MAEVYRATLTPDAHAAPFDVALKRLHPQLTHDAERREMFLTEADVGRLLKHPNVLRVYEAGTIDAQPYIVMERVLGADLEELLEQLRRQRIKFPVALAVQVALEVLRALDYVHGAKSSSGEPLDIVHQDVNPANIYMTQAGEVKLGDFGIARVKLIEPDAEAGLVKGKVRYMPPEVLAGSPPEQQLDLWGLAATLYKMLTFKTPFAGSEEALIAGDFKLNVVPPHSINSDVDTELSRLLLRALAAKPTKRPQTAAHFYKQLKAYLRKRHQRLEPTALGRFVCEVMGPSRAPAGAQNLPEPETFEAPSYLVPVEMSPTQRWRVAHDPAPPSRWLAVMAAAFVLVGFGALWYALNTQSPADKRSGGNAAIERAERVGRSRPGSVPPQTQSSSAAPETQANAGSGRSSSSIEFGADFGESADAEMLPDAAAQFRKEMAHGRRLMRQKRYGLAAKAFASARRLRPGRLEALVAHADALLSLGRLRPAERLVKKARRIDASEPRVHLLLGDVLWAQGLEEDARKAYERCAQLAPEKPIGQTARQALEGL